MLSFVGLEKIFQQQQDLFQGVTSDLVTTETLMGLSAWTMGQAWSWAGWLPTHKVASSVARLGSDLQIWHAAIFLFVLVAALKYNVVHQYYWNPRLQREKAAFQHAWKHGERARCLGQDDPHAHHEKNTVWPYGGSEPWRVSQTLQVNSVIAGVQDLTSYGIEDAVLALNDGKEHAACKEGMCIVKSTSFFSKGKLFLLYRYDKHDLAEKKLNPPKAADDHKKKHAGDDHKKKHAADAHKKK